MIPSNSPIIISSVASLTLNLERVPSALFSWRRIVIVPKSSLSKRSYLILVMRVSLTKFGIAFNGNFQYVLHSESGVVWPNIQQEQLPNKMSTRVLTNLPILHNSADITEISASQHHRFVRIQFKCQHYRAVLSLRICSQRLPG